MESYKAPFFYEATPDIFRIAEELRKNMTEAEKVLWERINRKQIAGVRFRRQHPIGRFIADFYCHKARLVIEVDGSVHDDSEVKERDEGREYELKELGLRVMRFTNGEIFTDIQSVISRIEAIVIKSMIPLNPPP